MKVGRVITDFLNHLRRMVFRDEGLTLVEVMVSMMIFLVVSVGVAGSLITGLRANVHARMSTMGKDVAQAQIEEMKGRTYYVLYSSDPQVGSTADVDLLDRYYPNLNASPVTDNKGWIGRYYSGTDAHFTKTSPADSRGIVLTVETRFVDSNRNVIVPQSTYDSNIAGKDSPPSDLVHVRVTASWTDRSGPSSYVLESLISATGQYSSGGEGGCEHSSNSHVDLKGGIVVASTGTAEPYIPFVNGLLGDAHATAAYSCTATMEANATGGSLSVVGGATYTGAYADVTGPPNGNQTTGPITVGPPSSYPMPTFSNSKARAEVEGGDSQYEVEAEGEANIGTITFQLNEVSGTPLDTLNGYKRWDFSNPTITATGSSGGDDGEDLEAEIEQEHGTTNGEAKLNYQQVNIIPLGKWPASTTANPSAAQGFVFIRDFNVRAHSSANAVPGGASNSLTYSATLGVFNPNKSGCTYSSTGDSCYDLYAISPSNPIQDVLLSNPNYQLQNALVTEWYSSTAADIDNAMYAKPDGTLASINVPDGLIKITAKYGTEIRWKTSNNSITLVSQQGLQQTWLGAIDISIEQNV